jgi:hypothetical protein
LLRSSNCTSNSEPVTSGRPKWYCHLLVRKVAGYGVDSLRLLCQFSQC